MSENSLPKDPIPRDDTVAMLEQSFSALQTAYGSVRNSKLSREPDCTWFTSRIDYLTYNGVFESRFREDRIDGRIQEVMAAVREKARMATWFVMPTDTPSDLGERITAAGGRFLADLKGMALNLGDLEQAPVLPAGVEIRSADDHASICAYVALLPRLLNQPSLSWADALLEAELEILDSGKGFRRYLAWERVEAIAGGVAFSDGTFAAIESLMTVPAARGRGVAGALATRAMEDARSRGCAQAVVWAGPGADPLYRRMGFVDVATAKVYAF